MIRHPHLSAAVAALLALTTVQAAQAVTPRLTADPEKKVLERAGWTYIGMSEGVLIYMKDAIAAGDSGGARRVVTAYESLGTRDREGFSFRSVESLGEFDCVNGRSRILKETYYEQPSLKGQTLAKADAATEWTEAVEGSVGMLRIAFACRDKPVA